MSEWTPGPLEAQVSARRDSVTWYIYADGAPSGEKLVAECFGPRAEANARLFATAPALAGMLLEIIKVCDADPAKGPSAFDRLGNIGLMARSVLAAARGERP